MLLQMNSDSLVIELKETYHICGKASADLYVEQQSL